MKQIGSRAFARCYKLESLTLPASLEGIGEYAFEGHLNLVLRVYPGTFGEQWAANNFRSREVEVIGSEEYPTPQA